MLEHVPSHRRAEEREKEYEEAEPAGREEHLEGEGAVTGEDAPEIEHERTRERKQEER